MSRSLGNIAVFAGGFSLTAIIGMPPNGMPTCNEFCDKSRTIISVALICFIFSLFLTVVVQYLTTPLDTSKSETDLKLNKELALSSLGLSTIGLVAGFVLIGVVLLFFNQKVAGVLLMALTAIFTVPVWPTIVQRSVKFIPRFVRNVSQNSRLGFVVVFGLLLGVIVAVTYVLEFATTTV